MDPAVVEREELFIARLERDLPGEPGNLGDVFRVQERPGDCREGPIARAALGKRPRERNAAINVLPRQTDGQADRRFAPQFRVGNPREPGGGRGGILLRPAFHRAFQQGVPEFGVGQARRRGHRRARLLLRPLCEELFAIRSGLEDSRLQPQRRALRRIVVIFPRKSGSQRRLHVRTAQPWQMLHPAKHSMRISQRPGGRERMHRISLIDSHRFHVGGGSLGIEFHPALHERRPRPPSRIFRQLLDQIAHESHLPGGDVLEELRQIVRAVGVAELAHGGA